MNLFCLLFPFLLSSLSRLTGNVRGKNRSSRSLWKQGCFQPLEKVRSLPFFAYALLYVYSSLCRKCLFCREKSTPHRVKLNKRTTGQRIVRVALRNYQQSFTENRDTSSVFFLDLAWREGVFSQKECKTGSSSLFRPLRALRRD